MNPSTLLRFFARTSIAASSTSPIILRSITSFAGICLLVASINVERAHSEIIYFDNFSGSGGSNLHGTAPDTRPGSETWTSHTKWKADGSIVQPSATGTHSFLPFVPEAGKIYSLSMYANVTGGQGAAHFFSLGFSGSDDVNAAYNPAAFSAWMIKRTNAHSGTNDVETYLGPGDTSSVQHDFDGGDLTMKIVLNTQAAQWSAEWFADNTSIRGPVFYTSNPTIAFVGFGAFQNTDGTVDDFTLALIPEPSGLVLMLIAAGGIFLRRCRLRAC